MANNKHLIFLVENVSKDKHLLCLSELQNLDKMNYKLVEKITDLRVIGALNSIPASKGTQMYLRLISLVVTSFTAKTLTASERIKKMWTALMFFRSWKKWLDNTDNLSSKNFVIYML